MLPPGMVRFIGRGRELRLLAEAYGSPRSEFVPIYGRRRVGKSELILRFMADKPGVYYLGQQSSAALQVREFLEQAAGALDLPLLAELRAGGWRQALLTVVTQWTAANPGAKLVLALDEFQWIAAASPDLLAELQQCWDRHWRDAGIVVLLVCGSYLGFMERDVLGRQESAVRAAHRADPPAAVRLPGRRPIPSALVAGRPGAGLFPGRRPAAVSAQPGRRPVDRTQRRGTAPGRLLAAVSRTRSFCSARSCASSAPTRRSCTRWRPATAPRRRSPRPPSCRNGNVHYYLRQLIDLGYLRRRYPLDRRRPNPKQVRFGIDDPLLRFWFRFVFPNVSVIRGAGPARALRDRIAPALEAWFGTCFEGLCREALPLIYAHEGVSAGFQVGEYWSRSTQIDVVGMRDDDWTDLGECKWGAVRSPAALEAELERKAERYPNSRGATLGRRYFVRRPPPARRDRERWYSLEDLYELAAAAS